MKKKFFIIFGVILILISAFQNKIFAYNSVIDGAREYMSDMLENSLNNGEISQECYEQLKKQAGEELTKAEMTEKLKENLFFFAVGQYANIAEDITASTLLNLADIWDYIFWDNDNQNFGFDEEIGEYIKNGLDPLIYSNSGGFWYSLPFTVGGVTITNVSGVSYVGFYDEGGRYAYPVFVTVDSGAVINRSVGGNVSLTTPYTGTKTSGFCAYRSLGSYPKSGINCFSGKVSVALTDFFGDNPSMGGVVLNGKGIIVNENPSFPSLSPIGALNPNYKNIVINNYNNGYPYPPNRGLDVNYYDYDYNYDVPFWEGQELETLEYPQEIEFPSIEFETVVVDSNIDTAIEGLSGWLIEFLLIAILLLVLGLII